MRTLRFRRPDLDSSTADELVSRRARAAAHAATSARVPATTQSVIDNLLPFDMTFDAVRAMATSAARVPMDGLRAGLALEEPDALAQVGAMVKTIGADRSAVPGLGNA